MKILKYILLSFVLTFMISSVTMAANDKANYNGHVLPILYPDGKYDKIVIVYSNDTYYGYQSQFGISYNANESIYYVNAFKYRYDGNSWVKIREVVDSYTINLNDVIYTPKDVKDANGQVVLFKSTLTYDCNGSSCPSNDVNIDGICDDCGMALTLRNTETIVDFAKYLVGTRSSEGYDYYAIFTYSDTSDSVVVVISKTPMTSPDKITLEGTSMQYNRISPNSTGSYGGSGWYNGFYTSYGSFIESNHTISNFPPALPMAEKVMAVTEEQMKGVTLPAVSGTMKTLLLCGVSLMALLVVLKLFGKRSLIFPN